MEPPPRNGPNSERDTDPRASGCVELWSPLVWNGKRPPTRHFASEAYVDGLDLDVDALAGAFFG